MKLTVPAYAKLNYTLDVLERREDGYHEMRMVMVSADLKDRVTIETDTGGEMRIKTNLRYLPSDGRNLAVRAAVLFQQETGIDLNGADIEIRKNVPVCAGMAGGSSDAAAVLRGLNEMTGAGISLPDLARMGKVLGADVPYCVMGGTMLAEGIGERLTPLRAVPKCHVVICKPRFSTSTAQAFAALDRCKVRNHPDTEGMLAAIERGDLNGIARRLYNVFEPQETKRHKTLRELRSLLIQNGALGACMTGTGPSMFGLFADGRTASRAAAVLRENCQNVYLTKIV